MQVLKEKLGRPLSSQDLADYLGLDVKTVRQYYRELGGIRLGSRYMFFEKEVTNAIQKRREVDSPSEERQEETRENLPDKKRGDSLGNRNADKVRRRLEQEDQHGLYR